MKISMNLLAFAAAISIGYMITETVRTARAHKAEAIAAEQAREEAIQRKAAPTVSEFDTLPPPARTQIVDQVAARQKYFENLSPEKFMEMQKHQLSELRKEAETNPDKPDALSKEEIDTMEREGRMSW